jgi:hypothetical protein
MSHGHCGIFATMPAAIVVIPRANGALGAPEGGTYQAAQDAVTGANSLREAVENGNLLDGLDEDIQREALAVLDALPAEVNQGVLDALRRAFASGSAVEVAWEEVEPEAGISHRVEPGDGGTVRITLITPHGRHYSS